MALPPCVLTCHLRRCPLRVAYSLAATEGQIDVFLISSDERDKEAGVASQRPSDSGMPGPLHGLFAETPPAGQHPITPFTTQVMAPPMREASTAWLVPLR